MKNYKMSFNVIILLNILLFKLSLTSIVFPFKIIKEEKNDKISSDDISYNYKNFLDEYFNQIVYINISSVNPPKDIKIILTFDECNFKIKNASDCTINNNKYEIDINAYSDINLKKDIKCENINYEPINYISYKYDQLWGFIGFKMSKYNKNCNIKNNIINNLHIKGYK